MSIDLTIEDGIATVTINRPDRLNALNQEHYHSLSAAWIEVRDNANIRAAIVTGAGSKSFCAGADLKEFIPNPPGAGEMWLTQTDQLLNRGLEVWKPIIAAVNGWCLGGGMTLLFATDIRIAASHARFGLPEIKRGIIAGNGGTQRTLMNLPYPLAMELLLTGDDVDAETASRWGIINKVVAPDELMPAALEYAHRIARNAPLALQASKELALRSRDVDLATGLRIEQMFNRFLMSTQDASEGARAFTASRPPKFIGN
ncbi:enoyl-CoA hydratase/isomerase family protein [Bradyrhizobium sp. NC92]|uniref:enoyl-CoA hydratase/isomerase family protein n=1 Tax=Bradyrhizobium sp. (strain NC92) TaxID=55395 RepID=UPI0021AAA15A|nr:enoyl-CoA hydratase/isomerase family protein [Bradyrhizobium sp. NC92]UWU67967.1 enoyl-CoA hydratase/isomerase family protein [Bradyrhizobium sp. NC92]